MVVAAAAAADLQLTAKTDKRFIHDVQHFLHSKPLSTPKDIQNTLTSFKKKTVDFSIYISKLVYIDLFQINGQPLTPFYSLCATFLGYKILVSTQCKLKLQPARHSKFVRFI